MVQSMILQSNEFKIKNPSRMSRIINFIVLLVMMSIIPISSNGLNTTIFHLFINILSAGYDCSIATIVLGGRYAGDNTGVMRKDEVNTMVDQAYSSFGTIEANQIKIAMVMGYFKPDFRN